VLASNITDIDAVSILREDGHPCRRELLEPLLTQVGDPWLGR